MFLRRIIDFIGDYFFSPQYSVGYFVLKLPSQVAEDITRLLKYYEEEEVDNIDFFKHYLNILATQKTEKKNFISTKLKFFHHTKAYHSFTKYFDLLKNNYFKSFVPFWWKTKQNLPQVEQGSILVYTLIACSDTQLKDIKTTEDLQDLIKEVVKIKRLQDPVFLYYIKFQGSTEEESLRLEQQLSPDYGY